MKSKFLLFFLLISFYSYSQIISTIAGIGVAGYSGDGGPALNAMLADMYYCYPAVDSAGNVYITQTVSNTIRRIDAAGIITTIAGTVGVMGSSGDGGPATNALLYHPTSIAVDNANNIFFAVENASIIRKIDPSGKITTVSGQSTVSCSGDGGQLINARFGTISGLAFDQSGNLYISDCGCNTVRKVNTSGVITTIAGNGSRGFSGDNGPAINAQLAYPTKVGVDNAGNVYIPDGLNHRVRKVAPNGIITTIAGIGSAGYGGDLMPATGAQLYFPGSIVVDHAGNIYIGCNNAVIRKIDNAGIITTFAGTGTLGYSGDGNSAALAEISLTEGKINIDNRDNIYFVNYGHSVIRKITNCLTATISSQPSSVVLCNAGNVSFTTTAVNYNTIQWQVNSGTGWTDLIDNTTYNGISNGLLSVTGVNKYFNGYQYRSRITNGCAAIYSVAATLTVNAPTLPSLTIAPDANNICQGTQVIFNAIPTFVDTTLSYQWMKNGIITGTNSPVFSDSTLKTGDFITCRLTPGYSCPSTTSVSNSIQMTVIPCRTGFYIPTAFTPNNDGKNDIYKPLIFGNVKNFSFRVYNRYGIIVYQSSDPTKGWDGKIKNDTQNGNIFIWTCRYEIKGQEPVLKKGSVLLIR